jgi:hypothetical protein
MWLIGRIFLICLWILVFYGETAVMAQPTELGYGPPILVRKRQSLAARPVILTSRERNGLYARINLGLGVNWSTLSNASSDEPWALGPSLGSGFALGYVVKPVTVLGGAVFVDVFPVASFETRTMPLEMTTISTLLVGPFVDHYPSSRGGGHYGASLGYVESWSSRSSAFGFNKATGMGATGWIGYDEWVSRSWSVGALLRLTATITGSKNTATASSEAGRSELASLSLLAIFTVLYN